MKFLIAPSIAVALSLAGCSTVSDGAKPIPWEASVTSQTASPPSDLTSRGVIFVPSPMPGINRWVETKLQQAKLLTNGSKPYRLIIDGSATISGNGSGLHLYTLNDLGKAPRLPSAVARKPGDSNALTVSQVLTTNPGGLTGPIGHLAFSPASYVTGLGVTAAVEGLAAIALARPSSDDLKAAKAYDEQVAFKATLVDGGTPVWHVDIKAAGWNNTPDLDAGMTAAMNKAFEAMLQ